MCEVCGNFFESIKLLYVCDFFCGREIFKKVLNTLEILDFIYKERVSSDQAHRKQFVYETLVLWGL